MTKYILESGSLTKYSEKSKVFYAEALDGLGKNPNILWCFFTFEEAEREKRFLGHVEKMNDCYPDGVMPTHVHASEEDFVQQVSEADLINLQGGDTENLKTALKPYELESLFTNKVVAGHSAGSFVLTNSYWSCGRRECCDGFGILPVKYLAHYNSDYGYADPRGPIDWEAAYEELKNYGDPELPIYALEEGDFVVFNK